MEPKGTIIFSTVGRPNYGFDLFCVPLSPDHLNSTADHRLSDGISINFNGHFIDEDRSLVFVSERTGSARIFLTRSEFSEPELLATAPCSLFHDRPIVKNQRVYFVSAHEDPIQPFKSWSAVYSAGIEDKRIVRLSPHGTVDYSPAISQSGKFIAVASYGNRIWGGEFHELNTDIVVFRESDPSERWTVWEKGGWPTWCGDKVIYFHRQADEGWWSVFRVELPEDFEQSGISDPIDPVRVTPPGLHAFTPAAMYNRNQIAVATRRCDKNFRHIEIFDIDLQKFYPVTEQISPDLHHYNPFVSPESKFLGYHRFRGESSPGESTIPHLQPVMSPLKNLQMLRLNGSFPSFSPTGDLIAFNRDFDARSGVMIVRSDGSKRWTVLKDRTAFQTSWSPAEENVLFTSIGPIFQSAKRTVQIARITFDPSLPDDLAKIAADVKILTREDTGNNAFPSCSPDGRFVVFRSGRSGDKNLYIVDAINGEFDGGIRQLTSGPWIDTMPCWSPAGKWIAFSSNRHSPSNPDVFSIYLIREDGSDLRRVYVAGPEGSDDVDRERINHVCFSRDGEWLLFTANLGGVTAEPVSFPNQFQPYGDLYVARLDGTGLRRLTWNGYENGTPAWHDRGRMELRADFGEKLRGEFNEPIWLAHL